MKKNVKAVVVSIILATSLSACTQQSPEQLLTKADNFIKEGNSQSAILALKNAVQNDITNPEIRYKLGKTYLDTGLAASAEKELRLALKHGYEANLVMPLIANSLLLQFKNNDLVEFVNDAKNLSLEAMTTLYTLQAQAYFALNNSDAANTAIVNANELSADSPYAKLGFAYGAFNKKEISVALNTVNELLEKNPDFTEALLLKGQLDTSNGDVKSALASFEKYHALLPSLFQGRIYLADSYIRNNMLNEAEKQVNLLLKINKNSPFINQLQSQIRFQQKNFNEAKFYAENAITYGGENQVVNTIAGVSSYELGLNEQAYSHLSKSIDLIPKNDPLHGLYQILKVKLGNASNEEVDQEALNGLSENHQRLLIESALTLKKEGKLEHAQKFLDVIDSSKIQDPAELTRLSMLKLALNDKTALLDLEKVIDSSPGDIDAQSILAWVYVAEGKVDLALSAADAIIQYHPDMVDGYNLKGQILVSNAQFDEAKVQYQLALKINPKDISANLFFGKLALRQNNEAEALKVFRRFINFEPIYLPALVTYFALEQKVGVPADAIKPIQKAYNTEPTNIKYALYYAKLLQANMQYEDATSILKKVNNPENLAEPYWKLLVELYLKQENVAEVEATLLKWTTDNPESGLGWRYLSNLYESQGDIPKALRLVQKGVNLAKTDRDNLLVLEAQLLISLRQTTEAYQILEKLIQLYGRENPVIGLLKGQLLMLENNYQRALPMLIKNYEFEPSTKVLKLILNSYYKINDIPSAVELAEAHIEKYPGDNTARLYLAGLVINDDKPFAESIYREVLKTDKLNQIALNNLAAVLQQLNRSEEAVSLSKNALQQAPDEPYLLEIYASALLKDDKPDEALSAYARAYSKSGKALTYAKSYIEALRQTNNEVMANKISQDVGIK